MTHLSFILIICVLLDSFGTYDNNHIIFDPRYGTPYCKNNGINIALNEQTNQYGSIDIGYDLLRENIILNIDFDNTYIHSCYLCDRFSRIYCDNNSDTLNTISVSLSPGLPYNIM